MKRGSKSALNDAAVLPHGGKNDKTARYLDARYGIRASVGDVGNAASWPFRVLYKRVEGAVARKVVSGQDDDLLEAFIAAGQELVSEGAFALNTSCGFLALRQSQLSARLAVPVATSSLLQIRHCH